MMQKSYEELLSPIGHFPVILVEFLGVALSTRQNHHYLKIRAAKTRVVGASIYHFDTLNSLIGAKFLKTEQSFQFCPGLICVVKMPLYR